MGDPDIHRSSILWLGFYNLLCLLRFAADVKRPRCSSLWLSLHRFLSLAKSSISSKPHRLSRWPSDSIHAPGGLLHTRNIHADPDKPADSNKPLNQTLKQNKRTVSPLHCIKQWPRTKTSYCVPVTIILSSKSHLSIYVIWVWAPQFWRYWLQRNLMAQQNKIN